MKKYFKKKPAGTQKFYAVLNGRDGERVIYTRWDLTHRATTGIKKCKFKSFPSKAEAERFFRGQKSVLISHVPTDVPAASGNTIPGLGLLTDGLATGISTGISTVYCDGGAKNSNLDDSIGGIGVFFGVNDPRNISMRVVKPITTNNRCELLAAILALSSFEPNAEGVICTDSAYTIGKFHSKTLDPEDVNYTLVRQLHEQRDLHPKVTFEKVLAHSGIPGNEGADQLATLAMK